MYAQEVPLIAAYARTSPEALADVMIFALLSIRQPFARLGHQMADVRLRGVESKALFGSKSVGFLDILDKKSVYHLTLPTAKVHDVVEVLAAEVTGLGIVKSAFIAQMLGFNVACFDTRNLEVLGYAKDDRPWRCEKTLGAASRKKKVATYIEATRKSGGAAHWWDNWCQGIAPGLHMTPDRVSRLHWEIIAGRKHKALAAKLQPFTLEDHNGIPF